MNWKPWPTDPRYLVSDQGQVKGIKGRILKPGPSGQGGYRKIHTPVNSNQRVDYMVLETFVGPRPEGMEVLHHNDVQHDNRLENLAWGSHEENCKQRTKNGKGTKSKYDKEAIRQAFLDGMPRSDIMKSFEISHVHLWRILGNTRNLEVIS